MMHTDYIITKENLDPHSNRDGRYGHIRTIGTINSALVAVTWRKLKYSTCSIWFNVSVLFMAYGRGQKDVLSWFANVFLPVESNLFKIKPVVEFIFVEKVFWKFVCVCFAICLPFCIGVSMCFTPLIIIKQLWIIALTSFVSFSKSWKNLLVADCSILSCFSINICCSGSRFFHCLSSFGKIKLYNSWFFTFQASVCLLPLIRTDRFFKHYILKYQRWQQREKYQFWRKEKFKWWDSVVVSCAQFATMFPSLARCCLFSSWTHCCWMHWNKPGSVLQGRRSLCDMLPKSASF